ncbi:ferredoxin [Streptomyces griseorubiginosus]|uniref:ferredoxin n=1 Tax=Streptomyces griseorubiginosus TaxID=67304 RepID=UPI0036264A8B
MRPRSARRFVGRSTGDRSDSLQRVLLAVPDATNRDRQGGEVGTEMDMRIQVDRDQCVGAGLCALLAPGVFTQDEDGLSAVLPGQEDGAGDPQVPDAARGCPVRAIALIESPH